MNMNGINDVYGLGELEAAGSALTVYAGKTQEGRCSPTSGSTAKC
jgi:hypothetical protein